MGFGFYGVPDLCERVEGGLEPMFIGFDEANAYLPEGAWLACQFPRARIVFRANNQVAQAIAAGAGAGLALLPHYIGRTAPGLRLCALAPVAPARKIWLLTRPSSRKDLAIRAVIEHLVQAFDEARELFEA